MVAYSDVPAVNMLYQEQEQITMAINMLDAGGKVTNFTVSPPPQDPGVMGMPIMMQVMIATIDPSPDLMAQARAALITRQNEIITELAAMGVTDSPPARSVVRE